ncbi:MAG: CPBP family intramembrane glutamic endopeptidase [Candidatus Omnitrophota bacterium]
MFDRNIQSRTIVILGLLGFFGCFSSLPFLSQVKALDFKFPLKKNTVFESTDGFLHAQGILSEPFVKKAKISSSQEGIIYIQKKLGIEDAYEHLRFLPLYYWQVDYTYKQEKESIFSKKNRVKILVDPISANVIGYNRFIATADYKDVRILSKNESEEIANNFFSLINFNSSEFKLTRYFPIEGKYIFEWEKEVEQLKTAKLKIKLEIFGDKVGNFQYFLNIPKKELRVIQANNIFAVGLSLTLYALVFLFGLIVTIISFFRRREIQWRFGLSFALLMSISFMVNLLKIGNYKGFYLSLFLVTSILIGIAIFLWTVIASSASKLFSKDSSLNFFPVKISYSIFLSYVFFFSGMGFTMFFFIFVIKIFNPIMTLGFDSFFSEFPSSKFSCLIAPLLSLSAAISEEILFRALMISFLKKYFKNIIWPVVISTFIWSFLHVSPVAYSDIFPNFVQGIILLPIGFLFSYIFIKFGLMCAITTHFLHDLVVIGSAFLEFNNFGNVNLNVEILLFFAIIPLIIAFYLRHKEAHV